MDQLLESQAPTSVGWFEVIGGPAAGERIGVADELRFGSEESGPGSLGGDRWLSPSHALIRVGAYGWTIEDLRSVEGTKVNENPVRGATELCDGDVIELGSSRLVMVPAGKSTKPPGPDLSNLDLRPLRGRRRRAWLIDRVLAFPLAVAIGGFAHGRVAVLLAYTALSLTYHFLSEALTGQTLGKKVMGLRVVDIHGRPLRPAAVAARALLLLIDSVLIGGLTIILTGRRSQRIGDLAARTVVAPADTPFIRARSQFDDLTIWAYPLLWLAPCFLLYYLAPWASLPSCSEAMLLHGGSCHHGTQVLDVTPAGRRVHLNRFDVNLVDSRTRQLPTGGEIASFALVVANTSDATLHPATDLYAHIRVVDPGGAALVSLPPHHMGRLPAIGPHRDQRVWLRYVLPADDAAMLLQTGTHLAVADASDPSHVGLIAFWLQPDPAAQAALDGLHN